MSEGSKHQILTLNAARGLALVLANLLAWNTLAQEPTQVRVATDPPEAEITCDGALHPASPMTLTGLAPGEHLIIARKAGYRESRRTITLTTSQRTAVDMKLDPLYGLILIHSVPSEADIEIEGADRGRTPQLVSDLPFGRYRVRLSKPGFLPKERELLIEDRTPQRLNVNLTSDSATLVLSSDPTGAAVLLNGLDRGRTPCTLDRIPDGENTLELTVEGFANYTRTLRLTAGQTEEVRAVLKPIPGKLTVVSIPGGARIYVDNQFRGDAPVTLADLEPGSYRVRAEMVGHEPVARTVQISRASDATEEFRLAGNTGQILITTQPAGVTVLVAGKEVGATEAGEEQTDRVSQPLKIELLAAGTHEVELTKPGFYSKTFTVDVEQGRTVTLHQILNRRFIPNYEVRTHSEVVRGVLVEVDPLGSVKLETKPGILRKIDAGEITHRGPLRDAQ